jgi:hypothetical protein
MEKTVTALTTAQLAKLGGGVLGYVREIDATTAKSLLGETAVIPAKATLFALYNADGSPVSISGTREAALGSAFEHELMAASVH